MPNRPTFHDGDRVEIDMLALTGSGHTIQGTVVGLSHKFAECDLWIVLTDKDNGLVPNETYPYHAFVCPHGHLTWIA